MGTRSSLSFADKTQSAKGIMSVILGGMSIVTCIVFIVLSFVLKGNAGVYIGSGAIVAIVTALIGLGFAIGGLREEDKKRLPIFVGLLLNIVILVAWIALFIMGIR